MDWRRIWKIVGIAGIIAIPIVLFIHGGLFYSKIDSVLLLLLLLAGTIVVSVLIAKDARSRPVLSGAIGALLYTLIIVVAIIVPWMFDGTFEGDYGLLAFIPVLMAGFFFILLSFGMGALAASISLRSTRKAKGINEMSLDWRRIWKIVGIAGIIAISLVLFIHGGLFYSIILYTVPLLLLLLVGQIFVSVLIAKDARSRPVLSGAIGALLYTLIIVVTIIVSWMLGGSFKSHGTAFFAWLVLLMAGLLFIPFSFGIGALAASISLRSTRKAKGINEMSLDWRRICKIAGIASIIAISILLFIHGGLFYSKILYTVLLLLISWPCQIVVSVLIAKDARSRPVLSGAIGALLYALIMVVARSVLIMFLVLVDAEDIFFALLEILMAGLLFTPFSFGIGALAGWISLRLTRKAKGTSLHDEVLCPFCHTPRRGHEAFCLNCGHLIFRGGEKNETNKEDP